MARRPLATPKETILHKLLWFKSGGRVSQRQWKDVVGVLKVQHDALDLAYLKGAANQADPFALLEKAIAEAPPAPNP